TTEELARQLLERMLPEERVGQLFIVEFDDQEISEESPIYQLITQYHIGGVVLKESNNNIPYGENALMDTWDMIDTLQRSEILYSNQLQEHPQTGEAFTPAQIPLFIALTQYGDGYPTDQIVQGLTAMPSELAIGATWNPSLAEQSGQILGAELETLGINMLLGPSLNVHTNPRADLTGDLKLNSFSGSTFWVSELGAAFISGIHQGGNNHLAVIGRDFPGFTGGDRPLSEEIPAVRKSLDQLLLTELPPFFNTTNLASSPNTLVDGLLLTHARYQAFQSNISTITPPITLDNQAISQLLSLQGLSSWHQNGGVIVSNELGSQAVRRYYTQIGEKFDPKFLARDAFLAGNDLMLTGNLIGPDDPNAFTSMVNTLNFFTQKYREDLAFAQQVDEAVLRILMLKYDLYNNSFSEDSILGDSALLEYLDNSDEIVFEVARQSATLIDPAPENLNAVLPNPPAANDFIVIFTDVKDFQACEECPIQTFPAFNALEQVAVRLYGPNGDGIIAPGNVASYTYAELDSALDQVNDPENLVIANISRAEWVIFLNNDSDPARPESLALSRFLAETPDLVQNRNIIVSAMNAPYYLNATDISTVTAYYSLYSKQPQFIEVAARILFQELSAPGASPVSINGIGYQLEQVLVPDPTQTIPLQVYLPEQTQATQESQATQASTPAQYSQGDTVIMETGIILDYNGNPTPDNTLVRFTILTTNPEGVTNQREQTSITVDGVARISYLLDTAGSLRVQASSGEPPANSEEVQIDISVNEEFDETEVPTNTPEPTLPLEETPQVTPTPEIPPREHTLIDWLLSLVVIIFVSLFAYQGGALAGQVRWGVRSGLTALIGGLLANAYISFNLPGAAALVQDYHIWGIVLSVAGGSLLGWGAGLLWRVLKR
ncbi:MAG TPA: glycoside hydrolase family 3 N-terminal domain-containing protein, partial [Anaerolineales bacterium]|nr:glycoside hydrolase family 3 N-terminal domain-containing protein [Anaerolineales bacterium]